MLGSATITISPLPGAYSLTGGGNYCPGGSGVPTGLAGSQPGARYQLYRGSLPAAGPISGSGSAINFGLQTAPGTYTAIATDTTTGCQQAMPGSLTVGISLLPNPYTITGGGNYCPGSSGVHIGLSGSDTWMTYQLYNSSTAIGVPIAGTGGPLDFGLYTTSGSYTITATGIGSLSCTGNMPGSVTIGISALPGLHTISGGGDYCSGGSGVAIGLNGSDPGTGYQLYRGSTPSAHRLRAPAARLPSASRPPPAATPSRPPAWRAGAAPP